MPSKPSMIRNTHPDRGSKDKRLYLGYWSGGRNNVTSGIDLPDPEDFVDNSWDVEERAWVVQRLKNFTPFIQWLGYSGCRFGCESHVEMGTKCVTAEGTWVWPEGFAHYVERHGVRPPQEFVGYLRGLPAELVAELDTRQSRIDAITAHWIPILKGDGCPDKGVSCKFESTRGDSTHCQKGNFGSNHCIRASDLMTKEFEVERKRHAAAIAPFCNRPWKA